MRAQTIQLQLSINNCDIGPNDLHPHGSVLCYRFPVVYNELLKITRELNIKKSVRLLFRAICIALQIDRRAYRQNHYSSWSLFDTSWPSWQTVQTSSALPSLQWYNAINLSANWRVSWPISSELLTLTSRRTLEVPWGSYWTWFSSLMLMSSIIFGNWVGPWRMSELKRVVELFNNVARYFCIAAPTLKIYQPSWECRDFPRYLEVNLAKHVRNVTVTFVKVKR
jgi:hypothetical protein